MSNERYYLGVSVEAKPENGYNTQLLYTWKRTRYSAAQLSGHADDRCQPVYLYQLRDEDVICANGDKFAPAGSHMLIVQPPAKETI
jgi:hypothetical protein